MVRAELDPVFFPREMEFPSFPNTETIFAYSGGSRVRKEKKNVAPGLKPDAIHALVREHPEFFRYPEVFYPADRVSAESCIREPRRLSRKERTRAFMEAVVILSQDWESRSPGQYVADLLFLFQNLRHFSSVKDEGQVYYRNDFIQRTGIEKSPTDRLIRLASERADINRIDGKSPFAKVKTDKSGSAYSLTTLQLYILDCLATGQREEQLKKEFITHWPQLTDAIDTLYGLSRFSPKKDSPIVAALKERYKSGWYATLLSINNKGIIEKGIPPWVEEELQSKDLISTAVDLSHKTGYGGAYYKGLFEFGKKFFAGGRGQNTAQYVSQLKKSFGITSLEKPTINLMHMNTKFGVSYDIATERMLALRGACRVQNKSLLAKQLLSRDNHGYRYTLEMVYFLVLELMMRGNRNTELQAAACTLWPHHRNELNQFFSLSTLDSFIHTGRYNSAKVHRTMERLRLDKQCIRDTTSTSHTSLILPPSVEEKLRIELKKKQRQKKKKEAVPDTRPREDKDVARLKEPISPIYMTRLEVHAGLKAGFSRGEIRNAKRLWKQWEQRKEKMSESDMILKLLIMGKQKRETFTREEAIRLFTFMENL